MHKGEGVQGVATMVWDFLKLVEPGRDEGAARVETTLQHTLSGGEPSQR